MWCVPELNREYVERMEDVLNLMEKPASESEPVVALDERPVQLHASERSGRPMAPGRIAQRDYEYVRLGTANVFCIVAPKDRPPSHARDRESKGPTLRVREGRCRRLQPGALQESARRHRDGHQRRERHP